MIIMRHSGLYVNDIEKLEFFYTSVFQMSVICRMEHDSNQLLDALLGITDVEIMTTKLITPYGRKSGQGDMLELVKVLSASHKPPELPRDYPVSMTGIGHIAFGVDDIYDVTEKVKTAGGTQKTEIVTMKNGNFCCFCRDPEGNWLELIQRCEETM